MIKYSLICDKDHSFEAWFANSDAYDKQRKRGLVLCPSCSSKKVSKALMAPNVGARQNKKVDASTKPAPPNMPALPTPPTEMVAQVPQAQRELLDLMRKVRDEVKKNSEYVGSRFADEARKIHYDEAPSRGIYGEASLEDANALAEEGIAAYPLPTLPEDGN